MARTPTVRRFIFEAIGPVVIWFRFGPIGPASNVKVDAVGGGK